MTLSPEESNKQCWRLGMLSALMILSGYKGELVHLPDRLRLPDDGDLGAEQCGRDPARVLRLGHHLEVRGGAADLPDHEREVEEHAGGWARQVRRAGKGWKAYVPARKQGCLLRGGIFVPYRCILMAGHLAQWSDAFYDCSWWVVVLFSVCVSLRCVFAGC